ncbi:MAG: ACT domain-containing protein [Lysobacterales bacterium]
MKLSPMPEILAVCRLAPDTPLPEWLSTGWQSVTRTAEELSVVCPLKQVPNHVEREAPWRGFKVAGPIEFTEIGVLASLCDPLAQAGISLFAVSTFDTDYLLVKSKDFSHAARVLRTAGHEVVDP